LQLIKKHDNQVGEVLLKDFWNELDFSDLFNMPGDVKLSNNASSIQVGFGVLWSKTNLFFVSWCFKWGILHRKYELFDNFLPYLNRFSKFHKMIFRNAHRLLITKCIFKPSSSEDD
jgi:hypothetical protein